MAIYGRLSRRYGPQGWWPGETRTEVMVGAVLTQNTAWKNVVQALNNLKANRLLHFNELYRLPQGRLAGFLKSSGYFRIKAKRLKNLVRLWKEGFGNSWRKVRATPTETLREKLLGVNGIGNETADSILLYALDRPTFVVDLYTKRVLTRHRLINSKPTYEEMQSLFHTLLPKDVKLFNEYHALIVKVGHEHCRKTAQCRECPLEDLLPDGPDRSR
jgi:endonuclease-3 related protein